MDAPPPLIQNASVATNVYADALVRQAVAVGRIRWAKMGKTYTCTPEVFSYDSPRENEVARASLPGCDLYFTRSFRNSIWDTYTNKFTDLWQRRDALSLLCKVAVHEEGHNFGLEHYPGTVMDPITDSMAMPRSCLKWALKLLPMSTQQW